jgi:hypothetical protein
MSNKSILFLLLFSMTSFTQAIASTEQEKLTPSEELFYTTYKWEFVDEKIVEKIEKEGHRGIGLPLLKWIATIPSLYVSANCVKEVKNCKNCNICDASALAFGAALLLLLRVIVGTVGQSYKTAKVRQEVFQAVANDIDTYEKYLPDDLVVLFRNMKAAPEHEVKKIIPRINEKIKAQAHDSLGHKYTFCRAIREGIKSLIMLPIKTGFFSLEYALGVVLMYVIIN